MKKKTKSKTRKKPINCSITNLVLSKYGFGMHYTDEAAIPPGSYAHVSCTDGVPPFDRLLELLYDAGVPLGTKFRLTVETIK